MLRSQRSRSMPMSTLTSFRKCSYTNFTNTLPLLPIFDAISLRRRSVRCNMWSWQEAQSCAECDKKQIRANAGMLVAVYQYTQTYSFITNIRHVIYVLLDAVFVRWNPIRLLRNTDSYVVWVVSLHNNAVTIVWLCLYIDNSTIEWYDSLITHEVVTCKVTRGNALGWTHRRHMRYLQHSHAA
jgi:hypothetical protein